MRFLSRGALSVLVAFSFVASAHATPLLWRLQGVTIAVEQVVSPAGKVSHFATVKRPKIGAAVAEPTGTASGSFIYDADTNQYSAINLVTTTTDGSFDYTFTSVYSGLVAPSAAIVVAAGAALPAPNNDEFPVFIMPFVQELTDAGGAVALDTVDGPTLGYCAVDETDGCFPYGGITAGEVVGAPLAPSTTAAPSLSLLAMLGMGLSLFATAWIARLRQSAPRSR